MPVGGRLVVAMANPILAVEPVAGTINEEVEIGATVYETLLSTDPNGHLVPWLCERWEFAEGAKTLALRAAPALATRLATYHGALVCRRA